MVLAKISCKMDQTLCRQSEVYQLYVKLPFIEVISGKISTFSQRDKYFSSAFLSQTYQALQKFKWI